MWEMNPRGSEQISVFLTQSQSQGWTNLQHLKRLCSLNIKANAIREGSIEGTGCDGTSWRSDFNCALHWLYDARKVAKLFYHTDFEENTCAG